MTNLAIWGASGHAKVVIDAARLSGRYNVVTLLDDRDDEVRPISFEGVAVVGGREALGRLAADGITEMIVAIGNCAARLDAARHARDAGLQLATIVHPSAVVAKTAAIGAGTFVAAGAVINAGAVIGDGVIVNTRASIDHDCVIGNGAHICPGVTLAGGVTIGDGAWIGVGSVVSNGVAIGGGSIIGAGSLVLSAVPSGVMAYGSPAGVVRAISDDDGLVRYTK